MKLTILLGCFNEKPTILKAIEQAKGITADREIFVIDNCSTDGTREILEGLKDDKDLNIILHPENKGTGYSYCECVRLARGDYLYAPGADLEYKMEDVYRMMELMNDNNLDAVFGSRLADRKGVSTWSLIKERPYWLGTIVASSFVNLLFKKDFTDIIATKLIKLDILKKLNFNYTNQAHEFELASRLCKEGYKIGEIGVSYKPRTHKQGKTIRAMDIIPAIMAIFRVRFFK